MINRMVSSTEKFTIPMEEMSPQKLNKGLEMFYLSSRKRDGREVTCSPKL